MGEADQPVVVLRDRDRHAWQVNAGIRLLSALVPEYGETKWLGSYRERQKVEELRRAGILSSSDSFNVIVREPTGETRYVTYYSDGGAKSGNDGFGDDAANLPTIELDLSRAAVSTLVADVTISAAHELSRSLGDRTREKISRLRGPPALSAPSAMSILHSGGETAFLNVLIAREAAFLVEFLDEAIPTLPGRGVPAPALAPYFDGYEKRVQADYRAGAETGMKASSAALLVAIARAAAPAWPFGFRPWSCGALGCAHVICRESASAMSPFPASAFSAGLAFRDNIASALKNQISLDGLLASVAGSADDGIVWIESAARSLSKRAEELRASLQSATSFDRFYVIHHEIFPVAFAALRAFRFLARSVEPREKEFTREANVCEEIKARSVAALVADFDNSIAAAPFLRDRDELGEIRRMSGDQAAAARLRKWRVDETLFPADFEPFVSGARATLGIESPFPGEGAGARLRHFLMTSMQKPRRYGRP